MKKYKSFYILFSAILAIFCLSGCRSGGKHIDRENVKKEHSVRSHKLKGVQKDLIDEAYTWLGTPYKYAHSEKGEGTDCSGFVMVVYDEIAGIKLPRNSAKQAEFCKKISQSQVKAGDLVFFATGNDPNRVSHVGIMIDDLQFIHASSSRGVVVSKMEGSYYPKHFMMYGRVPNMKVY